MAGKIKIIRAYVDVTSPETVEYKPYRTELSFQGKLAVEIPIPASEVVSEKGGEVVLTLDGWKSVLKAYSSKIEELHREYQRKFMP